ncbi:MAG: bifunctional adenosylcobinamide kinase/adenosylcobinamide-phosphate guanylyltransferase [Oscillospiraceae bacterium]|nr:bifunctional adenosylcobinamide kinase/adenosylcobinamide-phosphate guanylyltransferase [Oscillospiraceae bacterium]
MILIIGGAFQGKLDYAKESLGVTQDEIFVCSTDEIDFSRRCICNLENFTRSCCESGKDPIAYFVSNREKWENHIFLCQDLFCGVVPLDYQQRRWRQTTGRLCQFLSREAQQVSRIFCGLEQRLK